MRLLILASKTKSDILTRNLVETNYAFRPTIKADRKRLFDYLEAEADIDRTDAFITVLPDGVEPPSFLSSLDGEFIETFNYEFEKWPDPEPVDEVII
jgi:hypothetical protein